MVKRKSPSNKNVLRSAYSGRLIPRNASVVMVGECKPYLEKMGYDVIEWIFQRVKTYDEVNWKNE